jgi:hypothetical protein
VAKGKGTKRQTTIYETKERVTRIQLETGVEVRRSGRVTLKCFILESVQGCPEEWKYKDNPPRCEGPITDTYTKEMCRLEIIEEPMFKSATLEDGQTKCVKKCK